MTTLFKFSYYCLHRCLHKKNVSTRLRAVTSSSGLSSNPLYTTNSTDHLYDSCTPLPSLSITTTSHHYMANPGLSTSTVLENGQTESDTNFSKVCTTFKGDAAQNVQEGRVNNPVYGCSEARPAIEVPRQETVVNDSSMYDYVLIDKLNKK